MDKVTIYTDGSYINIGKKCAGIAFLYMFSDFQIQTIGYSSVSVYNSTESEILAIIYALKYLISSNIEYDFIEIRCDNIGIVDFFRKKVYIEYRNKGWKKANGKPINRCTKILHELTSIFISFPEGRVVFIKADKSDKGNKIAHRFARIASNLVASTKNSLYIKKRAINNDEFSSSQVIDFLKIEQEASFTILTSDAKVWETAYCPKMEKEEKLNRMVKWLELINQDIVSINTANIILTEDVHLKCKKLNLQGNIQKCARSMMIDKPIAVKELGENKYTLVMGLTRLIIAKTLGIPTIPCIVTELNFNEFMKKYNIE